MHRVRYRFDQCRSIPLKFIGQVVGEGKGDCDAFGEAACYVDAQERPGPTKIRPAGFAKVTRAARSQRIDGHAPTVSRMTYEFVAHDERRHAKSRRLNAVQFAPANTSAIDFDHDLTIAGDGLWNILHLNNTEACKHQCLHVSFTNSSMDLLAER